ncbi:D-alanyl-D-alanine carboxypeptidase family protein [Patescibacteria group bacterium]
MFNKLSNRKKVSAGILISFLGLFLVFLFPQPVLAEHVCVCYYDEGRCTTQPSLEDTNTQSKCTSFCQRAYEDKFMDALFNDDATSVEGQKIGETCTADTARVQEIIPLAPIPDPIDLSKYRAPTLTIPIPNLSFTPVSIKDGKLQMNFIADYVTAVYRYLIGISVTIVIVIIMIGGVQYVLAAGSENVSKAKERITKAVTGFVLLMGTYIILYTVNPSLVVFKTLSIQRFDRVDTLLAGENEPDFINGTVADDIVVIKGQNIINWTNQKISDQLNTKLNAAADKIREENYKIIVTSGYRSVERQTALIIEHCQNPPGSSSCNKKPGHAAACPLKDNDPANCPHTTGKAIDAWGAENVNGRWQQCIMKATCISNLNNCRSNPCQKALIDAMEAQGFCVLRSEPWHFEQPCN